jgi:hypothetical protein
MATAVAVGPSRTKSRCRAGSPARIRWTGPDWTPAEARNLPADRGFGASDLGKNPVHTQARPGGAATVVWAVEKQQQRVTAPFEEIGTLVLDIHQQLAEKQCREGRSAPRRPPGRGGPAVR